MKKLLLSSAVVLALGTSSAFAIGINPDAGGIDPTIQVGSLGWNNGNAISLGVGSTPGIVAACGTQAPDGTCSGGAPFQTYAMGSLANFNDLGGGSIGGLNLNGANDSTNYEWTFATGFLEQVTNLTGTAPTSNANFKTVAGGVNYFNIYFDANLSSDNLTGQGFIGPQLILSGTVLAYDDLTNPVGTTVFNATGLGGALDVFPNSTNATDNNYPGITTVSGTGSTSFKVDVTSYNSAFFNDPATLLVELNLNTFQNVPYTDTNPASCFPTVGAGTINGAGPISNGTPAQTAAQCAASSIGNLNGVDGPNIMFMTRASTSFETESVPVPAPGSLVLVGIGLAALGAKRRRAA